MNSQLTSLELWKMIAKIANRDFNELHLDIQPVK